MNHILLKTQNLCKYFVSRRWRFLNLKPEVIAVKAVDQCNLDVKQGEILAIVGESGSGKTTLGQCISRIIDPTAGKIWFGDRDITNIQGKELKELRQEIQMVFQDPGSSLNPRHCIEDIIALPMKIHFNLFGKKLKERVKELMSMVELPIELISRYPHALSGGQKQRVGIARALSLNPKLLVLDEPTSALDVSVQAKILHLLKSLQNKLGLTYIMITHNLSIVKNFSNRVVVMYLGRILEMASTNELFSFPLHPYTQALLSATPVIKEEEKKFIPSEIILEGEIPSPINTPKTCAFLSRCKVKKSSCFDRYDLKLIEVKPGHWTQCPHISN